MATGDLFASLAGQELGALPLSEQRRDMQENKRCSHSRFGTLVNVMACERAS